MRWVFLGLRVFLGGLFIYAGLAKSSGSAQFALTLVPFTFIPASWLGWLSILLPITEIVSGLLILIPPTKRLGALLILGLCLIFITALGWALANGIIISCACFGQDETPSATKMAVAMGRDVLLAVAAVAAFAEPWLRRPAHTPDTGRKTPASD